MTKKKKRGRPKELLMPNLIPDTPENIAKACMQGPPKEEWDYLNHPYGIVDNTPEEQQECTANRDAELKAVQERIERERQEREQAG